VVFVIALLPATVAQVIRANLDRSGLFRPIESGAFIERITAMEVPPRFADWRIIDAQALVVGQVTPLPDGRIRIEFRLWDVFAAIHTRPSMPRRWITGGALPPHFDQIGEQRTANAAISIPIVFGSARAGSSG
jgi:Tol biopolymer transport system component